MSGLLPYKDVGFSRAGISCGQEFCWGIEKETSTVKIWGKEHGKKKVQAALSPLFVVRPATQHGYFAHHHTSLFRIVEVVNFCFAMIGKDYVRALHEYCI